MDFLQFTGKKFSASSLSCILLFSFFIYCVSFSSATSPSSPPNSSSSSSSLFAQHCASEAAKYCPQHHLKTLETPEEVFELPCFLRHQNQLSKACSIYFRHWYLVPHDSSSSSSVASKEVGEEAQEVIDSCESDRKSFCPHLPKGLKTLLHSRCFLEKLQELSPECKRKMSDYSDKEHILHRRPSHEVWEFCQREPLLSIAVVLCLFLIPILLLYICCGVCLASPSPSSSSSPSKGRRFSNTKLFVFGEDDGSATIPLVSSYSFPHHEEKRSHCETGRDAVSCSTLEI